MSIKTDIVELNELTIEMQRLKSQLKILNTQYKKCECRISNYLKENEHPGVIFNNIMIIAKPIKKRQYTSKQERIERAKEFISNLESSPSRKDIESFFEELKGECEHSTRIQLVRK